MFPTLIGISFIAFLITQLVPGGPLERIKYSMMGGVGAGGLNNGTMQSKSTETLSEEDLSSLKELYGYDKPWYIRYFIWLYKLVQFDLGTSFRYMVPVTELIKERLPISLYYGLVTAFLIYAICIPLGILKALKNSKLFDSISSWIIFAGYAVPPFALGIALLVIFASNLGWFPLGGFVSDDFDFMTGFWEKTWDIIWHSVLPLIAYLLGSFATMTMVVKNSVLENISQDFMKFAMSKGLSRKRAIFFHAFRNSLIPIATTIGDNLGVFLMGSFIIETIFNIDGIGLLGYTAITERDYPVVLGILIVSSLLKLLGNIISDMAVAIVDPRVRFK